MSGLAGLSLLAGAAAGIAAFLAAWAVLVPAVDRRRLLQRLGSPGADAAPAPTHRRGPALRPDTVAANPALRALLRRFRWTERRAEMLDRAGLGISVSAYALVLASLFGLGAVAGTVATGILVAGMGTGLVLVAAAEWFLRARVRARRDRFDRQLPGALQAMATALKSGFSILEAVRAAARESDPPLSRELSRILDEHRVGASFDTSLAAVGERIGSADFGIVVHAFRTHRRVGGNLAEILDHVAETMREREKLRGHVRALTAEQRASSVIVGMLPVWVLVFFLLVDPAFIAPLWQVPLGRVILGVGAALEVVAFLLLRRIAAVET